MRRTPPVTFKQSNEKENDEMGVFADDGCENSDGGNDDVEWRMSEAEEKERSGCSGNDDDSNRK